jgi:hypothetical protein
MGANRAALKPSIWGNDALLVCEGGTTVLQEHGGALQQPNEYQRLVLLKMTRGM